MYIFNIKQNRLLTNRICTFFRMGKDPEIQNQLDRTNASVMDEIKDSWPSAC